MGFRAWGLGVFLGLGSLGLKAFLGVGFREGFRVQKGPLRKREEGMLQDEGAAEAAKVHAHIQQKIA